MKGKETRGTRVWNRPTDEVIGFMTVKIIQRTRNGKSRNIWYHSTQVYIEENKTWPEITAEKTLISGEFEIINIEILARKFLGDSIEYFKIRRLLSMSPRTQKSTHCKEKHR